MSNIYHTEPPTQGKALVHTTMGDIDIELWSKEVRQLNYVIFYIFIFVFF
jgi:peptidyl-prolyl cis-trans isomerase SDCCAG10